MNIPVEVEFPTKKNKLSVPKIKFISSNDSFDSYKEVKILYNQSFYRPLYRIIKESICNHYPHNITIAKITNSDIGYEDIDEDKYYCLYGTPDNKYMIREGNEYEQRYHVCL